ncbi:MAG TPA: glycosyltransferase [Propylenella sp.]|nr:glycosyltransferase [Propylenella sp.]
MSQDDSRKPRSARVRHQMQMCRDAIFDPSIDYPAAGALRVVLTRYAMALPWTKKFAPDYGAWLAARFEVFSRFCAPSVLNQVARPDLWLLGFDGAHRDAAAPVVAALAGHAWIVPVWQERQNGVPEQPFTTFQREIRSRLEGRFRHVITTRLDSDDALNRDFVAYLARYSAAALQGQPDLQDFWVSFPFGAYFEKGACALLASAGNHFLSRVQSVEHFRADEQSTALYGNHARVFERGPVFTPVTNGPMWIEVFHGNNVQNFSRGRALKFKHPEAVLSMCGLPKPAPSGKPAWRRGLADTLRRTARRALRRARSWTLERA